MKTQLDIYDEIYLERLCEGDFLTCWVRPMTKGKHNLKLPSETNELYRVEFRNSGDYLVLQEVTDAALGLAFTDVGHLAEISSAKVTNFLQIQDLFPGSEFRHFVLRTAHSAVHVFSDTLPEVFLESSNSHPLRQKKT